MNSIVISMTLVGQSTGDFHALLVSLGPSGRCSQYGLCMALGLPLTLISHSRNARH